MIINLKLKIDIVNNLKTVNILTIHKPNDYYQTSNTERGDKDCSQSAHST